MAAVEFIAHADRLGRAAPITSVRLSLVNGMSDAVARVSWLERVEELDLSGNLGVGQWLEAFLATARCRTCVRST